MDKILHLNLCGEYFHEIKDDKKPFEFRLYNDHWKKRLVNRDYDLICIKWGYPKNSDTDRIIWRKYKGYTFMKKRHKHFGSGVHDVFAIDVRWKV